MAEALGKMYPPKKGITLKNKKIFCEKFASLLTQVIIDLPSYFHITRITIVEHANVP